MEEGGTLTQSRSHHGLLSDLTNLSTAIRDDSSMVHRSQSFVNGGNLPSQPLLNPVVASLRAQSHIESQSHMGTASHYERHASYLGSWIDNSRMLGENTGGETHPLAGSVMIINAALGAAYLNFPSAFHEAGGVITANIVQVFLLCFIYPALLTLAYCADWNGSKTLQEVLAAVWGRPMERFCSFCIILYCFGICTTFFIIVGDQFDRVFASLVGPYFCHEWYMNRAFTTVAAAIVFVMPFCYPKKIDFLKYVSSIGVFSVVYVAGLIVYLYFRGDYTPGEVRWVPAKWDDVFLAVPTICFGYQCHVSTIPIYSCYKVRNPKTFAWSSAIAITCCIVVYTMAASFGYLTFGSKIASDILTSYDANDPLIIIAVIAISIKTYATYPLLCFCGNAAVSDFYFSLIGAPNADESRRERFRLVSVTIWFLTSLVLATVIPNIGAVIKLLGSLAALFIFIMPGMCMLKISEKPDGRIMLPTPKKWIEVIGGIFIVCGGFLFGVVLTNACIADFVKVQVDPEPICLPIPAVVSS